MTGVCKECGKVFEAETFPSKEKKKFTASLTCVICGNNQEVEFEFQVSPEGKLFAEESFECDRCCGHGLDIILEERG